MKKKLSFLIITLIISQGLKAQTLIPPAGSGTYDDPYQISSLNNLYWMSQVDSINNKFFIQTNDIDASPTVSWFNGKGFLPIGKMNTGAMGTNLFNGYYDGQGHSIDNIFINRPNEDHIGFFNWIAYGRVSNLSINNATITGGKHTGCLTGRAQHISVNNCHVSGSITGGVNVGGLSGDIGDAHVSRCYSTADVTGQDNVGGLVGFHYSGIISRCYTTGSVSGESRCGGLAGSIIGKISNSYSQAIVASTSAMNDASMGSFGGKVTSGATIENCYSTGQVTYIGTNPVDKGFIGEEGSSNITYNNNFFDSDSTYQNTGIGATAKTTSEMLSASTFISAGWNFSAIWIINSSYPEFKSYNFAGGEGNDSIPYQISTLEELRILSEFPEYWDNSFIQIADIDATSTNTWNNGKGFFPIGANYKAFVGSYNGNGHIIDGLFMNYPINGEHTALFGDLYHASVSNLGLTNVNISGTTFVGALAGMCIRSDINCCYAEGTIKGQNQFGGFVGKLLDSSLVSNCYIKADVTNNANYNSNIYGLFCSYNDHSYIRHCYAIGNVYKESGADPLDKGFACQNINNGHFSKNYFDKDASNQLSAYGAKISTTPEMTQNNLYLNAGWDFVGETANGNGDYWNWVKYINDDYPILFWEDYPASDFPNTDNNVQLIKVYPNPNQGSFRVSINAFPEEMVTITLFNHQGQSVFNTHKQLSDYNNKTFKINAEHLPAGVYFLRIYSKNHDDYKKIVIE